MTGIGTQSLTLDKLRQQTLARWVAQKEMNQTLISKDKLRPGRYSGVSEQGNQTWHWLKKVAPSEFPDILRIELEVATEKNEHPLTRLEFFKNNQS